MKSRPSSTSYYAVLAMLHEALRPRTYLEIGVSSGASMALAHSETLCIGVDPRVPAGCRVPPLDHVSLFEESSDSFFANQDLETLLGGKPLDLAFIDGMHLFEFALRDFMSIEANSHAGSVVLVHDCLPVDEVTSARRRTTSFWTGDVWKLVACLLKHRPDLELMLTDTPPTGLCLISGLERKSRVLSDLYEQIVDEYAPLGWEFFEADAYPLFTTAIVSVDEAIDRLSRLSSAGWSSTRSYVRHLAAWLSELQTENEELRVQVTAQASQLNAIHASTSWRLSVPIRVVGGWVKCLARGMRRGSDQDR